MNNIRVANLKIAKNKIILYSLFSSLYISLIGQIAVCEFFAIIDFFSIRNLLKTLKRIPDLRKINTAYFFIFISQVISDVVNESQFDNQIRGWANILMALVLVTFLSKYFYKSSYLIIIYLFWQIIGMLLFNEFSFLSQFSKGFSFKFFLAPILNNLILIISWYMIKKKYKKIQITMLFISYGLFCVLMDYRSNGLFMIIIGFFYIKRKIFLKLNLKKIFKILFLFLLITQILYSIFVSQILSGNIVNERTKMQLNRLENPYNLFELIVGGRAETFVAISAIKDMPIFGHGSWAPDPTGKYHYLLATLVNDVEKYERNSENLETSNIPSHSVILGIWMTSGIIGFCGIVYILIIFLKSALNILKNPNIFTEPYIIIVAFFMISGIWTFLFSPLAHIRQTLPLIIAFIITLNQKVEIKKLNYHE
jgi:O-antigen ligase